MTDCDLLPTSRKSTADAEGQAPTNRREFLKRAAACGLSFASFGAVGMILPKELRGESEPLPYDWDRHRWVYLVDVEKCIGCGACARACRAENDVPEGMYRTWIERYEIPVEGEAVVDSPNGGEDGFGPGVKGREIHKAFFVPKLCNHCEATPCTQVCPVGASYSTHDGAILVDQERCIGCGYCVQACPYGSRFINPTTHTADKCTWCYHRVSKGMKPACVAVCPVGARIFGDRKDPSDPVNEILAREKVHVLQPELLTKPQCYYRGLDMEVR